LQSGQSLTDEEKKLLGLPVTTTTPTASTKTFQSPVEKALGRDIGSSVDYAANIDAQVAAAQAAQRKPVMSPEQIAGGGQVKWVGSVDGNWQVIMPIGSPLVGSKAAGWTSGTPATTSTTKTAEQTEAYNNAKATAQQFVDLYGGTLADYFDAATGKVKQPSADVINKKLSGAGGKKEVSRVDNGDGTFTVTYDDKSSEIIGTKTTTPTRPIGTPPAFVYDPISKTWKMPAKPAGEGNWVWDNVSGWTNTLVNPGATGMETGSDRTLAQDTFKNTLALFFGAKEMSQPWANALFKVVSSYYKSGSTIDESLNLALQDARNKPELEPFTKRFAGVYALQDRLAKGEAIDVPTIAEFFKSEATLGDKLREVGLGDLATQELLGEVLGTGKSVATVLNLVNDVFMTIDNAPEALKKDLQVVAPGIDRTSIAKALLLGKRGAEELQKQIKEVSVLSAAKSQGVALESALAADIAARNFDYNTSLTNFGTVAKGAQPLQKLTEISTGQAVKPAAAQESLIKSLFQQDVKAQEQIRLEAEKEAARFSGASGTFGSRSLASRNRANRAI
jgi:hypothetical protein